MADEHRSPTLGRTLEEEATYIETIKQALRARGIGLHPGLSVQELSDIEWLYGVRLPDDLRALLRYAVPVGDDFPDWRGSRSAIQQRLSWPLEGILFDVERNGFWLESWGPKPISMADALEVAREAVARSPRLIPIYKHRFIPAEPVEAGNPVLSVYQTDVIHYGNDMPGYFQMEFQVPLPEWARRTPRPIRFWDEVIVVNAERD